jgi:hypothetical protein
MGPAHNLTLPIVDFDFILGCVRYMVKKKIGQVIIREGGFWKNVTWAAKRVYNQGLDGPVGGWSRSKNY